MSTGGLRERNRLRTREEIAVEALTLFEYQGYDATTCEDIAAAADVSVRTFFRYFETKADVLFVDRSDETGPLAALAELRDRPAEEGPVDVLRHALRHPADVLEARRELVVRQFRVLMATESLQELRLESFHRFEEPFARALAARLGTRPDDLTPRLLAAVAASSLRVSIECWVASGAQPGALRPLLDEALDHVHDGFGPLAALSRSAAPTGHGPTDGLVGAPPRTTSRWFPGALPNQVRAGRARPSSSSARRPRRRRRSP